ncbi:MAG: bis(5'-nucleosyl)-tetraphosphatase (symmetrical) YqeK [Chloroflexi bacterium]|nr:bis(5'-nucleosyl)-tetraphosphatase (symmetrical) YqeK [Chloroflexota bacterium]
MAISSELLTRVNRLPLKLLGHVQRVSQVCHDLAIRYECDLEKAELAGLAHDLARAMKGEELLALAESYNLDVGPVDRAMPIFLHGPVAAEILKKEFGIDDPDLLEAVTWHTTAKSGMCLFSKVLFVGDKTEPGRFSYIPVAAKVAELAANDLDGAILEFLNWHISIVLGKGSLLHPAAIEARNHFLSKRGISGVSLA